MSSMHANFEANKHSFDDFNRLADDRLYSYLKAENVLFKRGDTSTSYDQTVPVTFLPSATSRVAFEDGYRLQPIWNKLTAGITRDPEFVSSTLDANVLRGDDFTTRMVELYRDVQRRGIAEEYSLAIVRADYMANQENSLRTVEMNTISVGFAGLSPPLGRFHRKMAAELGRESAAEILQRSPDNGSTRQLAAGLLKAQELYGSSSCILTITEPFLINHYDLGLIEREIDQQSGGGVHHLRRTFQDLVTAASLGPNNELLLRPAPDVPNIEVGVVYYRTGYAPEDFPESSWWDMRLMVEFSRAIKCPNIGWHVAGVKHFQNIFSREPLLLRRYLDDAEANSIADTFVGIFDVSEESYKMAYQCPEKFVLKPNREGGGNNTFGNEIVPKMRQLLDTQQAGSYGLMEFIVQQPVLGYVLPPYNYQLSRRVEAFGLSELDQQVRGPGLQLTNELGFYGVHLAATRGSGEVVKNITAGHLIRTKLAEANEIGIVKGYGALDTPWLV